MAAPPGGLTSALFIGGNISQSDHPGDRVVMLRQKGKYGFQINVLAAAGLSAKPLISFD
jgi:hypothetical protein